MKLPAGAPGGCSGFAREILSSIRESLLVLDGGLRVVAANASFFATFGVPEAETIGRGIYELGGGQWDIPQLRELLGTAVPRDATFMDFRIDWSFSGAGRKVMLLNGGRLRPADGKETFLLLAIDDITGLEYDRERYRLLYETMTQGVVHQDSEGRIISANRSALEILGKTREEFLGSSSVREEKNTLKADGSFFPGTEHPAMVSLATGKPVRGTVMGVYNYRKEEYVWIRVDAIPLFRPGMDRPYEVYTLFDDITSQRRDEESLRTSEAMLDAFFNNTPAGMIIYDSERRYVRANRYAAEGYGAAKEFLRGKSIHEVLPGDLAKKVDKAVGHVLRTGRASEPAIYSARLPGRNNELTYWLGVRFPVSLPGGGAGVGTVTTDITGRIRAEQKLSEAIREAKRRADQAEERRSLLEALMSNMREGILITDGEGRIRMISDYLARLAGIDAADAVGQPADTIEARLSEPAYTMPAGRGCPVSRALERGETVTGEEYLVRSAEGGEMTVLVNAQPVKGADGRIMAALASWRDISERKKMEDSLRRNEYELRTLVDNSPDLVFRQNRQYQYVYANSSYERVTGIPRDRFTGRTNADLGMPDQQVEYWKNAVRKVFDSGRESSAEFEMVSFFGKRYFSARLIPEFDKSGLVVAVLVIARDITERRRGEERIRYISFHDPATGLFNRAFFEEELRRFDAERNLPISIIMGDVNNLKLTNDVFGHAEGDLLLTAIAESMRGACRKSDIVARWGGDEFAVILPSTPFATADEVRRRIVETAAECGGLALRPGIALGLASKEGRDANIYQVIRQAEERMYERKLADAGRNQEMVLGALLERMKERDAGYPEHAARCRALVREFAAALGLSGDQSSALERLAEMHGIGSVALPGEILRKPGRLNAGEWEILKKAPETAFRIVKTFPETARISDETLSCRELWDGSGYPRGLRGNSIPYLARVFSVVDAFDTMTHARPYAPLLSREEALREIRSGAGSRFDPGLAERFAAVFAGVPAAAR